MKIAFDHQIFALQPVGGISRYFVRLAEHLVTIGEELKIIAPFHCNYFLDKFPEEYKEGSRIDNLPFGALRFGSPLNRYLVNRELCLFLPDVLHETFYSKNPVVSSGSKRILTVYDMINERFPNSFSRFSRASVNKRAAVERADHIICISHSTKQDLCETFNVQPEKVSVVHLGFDKLPYPEKHTVNMGERKPFLLFVGKRGGYKNFEGMLRAVSCRPELQNNFKIIAFGGGGFSVAENRLMRSLGFQEQAVQHVAGGDKVLGKLYREAQALVYPSIYEGFGLPPLEAMSLDCPVIVSNTSSIPEVVGGAGEYFSPYDFENQAQAICNVVFNRSQQKSLVVKGNERLKQFSWRACASATLEIYKNT